MKLIGFEQSRMIDEFLVLIGINSTLSEFLPAHLSAVLQKQHSGTTIQALELVSSHNFDAKGMQDEHSGIVHIDDLVIPIDVRAILAIGQTRMQLDLLVRIVAQVTDGENKLSSDVVVKDQRVLQ